MSADPAENTYLVTFETLTYGGEALGRLPDGRAVFVPFVLPGERARVRLTEEKRRFARGTVVELLEAAPQRIAPRCRHFTACGGCHYQHLPYAAQAAAKREILKDQLERIGRLADPDVRPTVTAPHAWYYRNTVQFHQDPQGRLGYINAAGDAVMPIEECHLPEPALNTLWPQFDLEFLPELDRLGLRLGSDGTVLATFESLDPAAPDFQVDFDLSAVHLGPDGSILMAGDDHVVLEVLDRPFRVSAGAFFQVNALMAEKMVRQLLEEINAVLSLGPETTVLDVYCGVGLFSAFLAERAGQVVGVEASPYATYDFEVNLDEFDNVSLYEGEAGEVLPQLPLKPDVVVLDPPRAGVELPALEAVLAMSPKVIAYVSCDPATLARDARRLTEGGYRLAHATPFDLFPQTYHIESLSLWLPSPD
jgi:23S rRNA (uracil1939-C5)-methyltransferase